MIFTKKAKQRLICLLTAASLSLPGFCISGMAASYDVDCSKSLSESGAYALEGIEDESSSAFTLEEFKGMLSADENLGRTIICTFEVDDEIAPQRGNSATWIDTFNLKYGESGEKYISVTQDAEYDAGSANTYIYEGISLASGKLVEIGSASSGSKFLAMTYKLIEGEDGAADIIAGDEWSYTFAPGVSGDNIEVVKSVGLVSVLSNAGVKITAHYAQIADGKAPEGEESKTITVNEDITGTAVRNTYSNFVGFQAPDDCYISKIVFHATNKFMGMDDLCLITQEVSSDMTTPSKLEITAPDTVEGPCYDATLEYNYSAKVFDQFGRELDREIEITVDNNDVAELTEDGRLIIKQQTVMPETITLTASAEGMTVTKTITVDTSASPYYDASKIGVDSYTAYDEEKYGEYTEQTEYTLEEFIAAMETAAATDGKDVAMVNGEGINEEHTIEKVRVPLLKDKEKYFDLVHVFRLFAKMELVDGMQPDSNKKMLAPSGTHVFHIIPPVSGENVYDFDTSLTGDYRVTSFGFVYIGRGSNTNIVADGFGVHATFSDGTQKTYGTDQIRGGNGVKEENTFYGIKAPAGHYITRIQITTQPRAWACIDDFGFILEKPDILTIKPDYEQFTFSSFCDQDMNNITEDIALPDSTTGGCTVDWTALTSENENSDVIETGETNLGKLNVPEVPEKSNVRLRAAMTYGDLTFVRNFDLYVPSKLERDYKKISIPEKTKENITLPSVGSEYGSTITWKSLNPELIDDNGKVTRPDGQRDKYCVLQATLTNASGTLVKEIGVTVEGTGSDEGDGPSSNINSVIGSINSGITNNNSSGIVSSGGGGGGGGAKTPVPVEVKPPVEEGSTLNNTFADVPQEHWAYESIAALTEKGIVNGTGGNSFSPEKTVTREQYLSMLVRAFGFTNENANAEFSDVEKDSWYFDAVAVAQSLGICSGYEDGSFGIGKEITREEMAVMAYRSALLAKLSVEPSDENIAWKDAGEISHFAYDAVAALNNAGIIKGISEEKFSPKTTTTRAQAAVIVQRLLSAQ